MKIKYVGPGEIVSVSHKGSLYKFNPDCEVEDKELADILLADKSYIEIKDEIKPIVIPVSKQGKKFVCSVCGKEFKSAIALTGHMRSHKRGKK